MIRTNKELFDHVHRIIHELIALGDEPLGIGLSDAAAISTVPGEIFGEILLVLRKVRVAPVCRGHLCQQVEGPLLAS